jgi:hypothetical protein
LRKHGLDSRIAVRVPHFLALPTIVGSSDLVATVPRPLMADATSIEILSHSLRLPELVIRQFWHERFDAEPALMWLRKTLRVAVANASQLRRPRQQLTLLPVLKTRSREHRVRQRICRRRPRSDSHLDR